ncbi:hypothetical protein JCM6882_008380 [Rhodosporidiobolus microsporus]
MTLPSPLVFIPKKATQDVDFAPQLRSVIAKSYSESPDNYTDELAALNRARQDALRGSAGSDVTARDLLYKYFGQLELLELRFPDLRVPFPWSDAFTHVKISQQSLAYEKASVIFNIGATLSSLAASSPRSAPEGLKRAFHSFRSAAGMFVYINENFLHAPSTDLSKDVVKLLVGLMGAQAVEVFIETMGPATGKSAGLRSKLCMQASAAYAAIVEDAKEWVTKGVFLREWSLLIQSKAKYFASLANYHRSVADTAAGKYGEGLARLNVSEALAKEANRFAQSFAASFSTTSTSTSLAADSPNALSELTKAHLSLVSEARTKAQKDNDIVYNEVVPSEASLAPIEKGKPVAEPIPIHDVYATPDVQKIVGPDLFAKLVPLSVHESASLYSEEKAKLVRAEVERVELADEELASALEYMGLPASLARFQSGAAAQASLVDPGPQVRGWADEVRAGETDGRVEDLFRRLEQLKQRAASQLDQLAGDLDAESRECESMRAKYGHLWEQPPAAAVGATRSFRQDLKAHRESLEAAASSDAQARGLWEGAQRDVGLLADPTGQALERVLAEAIGAAQGGKEASLLDVDDAGGEAEEQETKRKVEQVSDALARLNKIKKERGEVMRDLKEKVQADDISHILILNRKGAANVEPALFATELEKFRPHQQRLTQTLQAQQSCLADVNTAFKSLNDGPRARDLQNRFASAERAKRDLVARLGHAAQAYGDVRTALGKGTQFYQDSGDLVDGLKDQVQGYLAQRNAERERMVSEADIKQRLEGGGGASAPAASPPPAPYGGAASLDRAFGSLNLGNGGGATSPPPPPSWTAPSYPTPPPQAPQPPAATSSPYGNFPSSGVFGLGSSSTPSASSPAPPPVAPSPYQPRPPQPPSAYPTAPPVPAAPTSSYSSYQSPYATSSPAPPSSYAPPPQASRQSSLPPPPQPVSHSSYSSSGLPPPPAPLSYSSTPSYGSSPAYGSTPSYSSPAPPPVPQPPAHQPQYGYQQQQPAYGQQYGQQQQQQPSYPYGAPPPPPRPY